MYFELWAHGIVSFVFETVNHFVVTTDDILCSCQSKSGDKTSNNERGSGGKVWGAGE